jgi:hypothetical protein
MLNFYKKLAFKETDPSSSPSCTSRCLPPQAIGLLCTSYRCLRLRTTGNVNVSAPWNAAAQVWPGAVV